MKASFVVILLFLCGAGAFFTYLISKEKSRTTHFAKELEKIVDKKNQKTKKTSMSPGKDQKSIDEENDEFNPEVIANEIKKGIRSLGFSFGDEEKKVKREVEKKPNNIGSEIVKVEKTEKLNHSVINSICGENLLGPQKLREKRKYFHIQLAAYEKLADAFDFCEGLIQRGHRPFVYRAAIPNKGVWYRVVVGEFFNRNQAKIYVKNEESFFRNLKIGRDYLIENYRP